jgi:pilus assembly protein CpaE
MTARILVLDRDDEIADACRNAAPNLDGMIDACHQSAKAERELATDRYRVLVAGPSFVTPSGMRFLQRVHEEHPEVVGLLISSKDGSNVPVRDVVRTGASDLIPFPAAAQTIRAALERAVDMAGILRGHQSTQADGTQTGKAYTITSPSGGSGKTFFATNLAYELAVRTGKRVGIIDLDFQFGEVETALRLRPKYTIYDVLQGREGGGDSLKHQLREYMARTSHGIEVLAAPHEPHEADIITSPDVTSILSIAKELYHYVIVDTPPALSEPVLAAFDLSEKLIAMATLDLPSVKNLGVFLATLDRLKIPQDGVSLVLNKADKDVGLSPAEVQRLFPQGFKGILPYSKDVSRSFNTGTPVLEQSPNSEISRTLLEAIHQIIPEEPALTAGARPEPASNGHRRGFFRRVYRTFVPVEEH